MIRRALPASSSKSSRTFSWRRAFSDCSFSQGLSLCFESRGLLVNQEPVCVYTGYGALASVGALVPKEWAEKTRGGAPLCRFLREPPEKIWSAFSPNGFWCDVPCERGLI